MTKPRFERDEIVDRVFFGKASIFSFLIIVGGILYLLYDLYLQ
ncbi:hypothetical protein [uncultured Exiguobacterium sp.]|nr:hypothetical protein [uncultured Exiguobacterium sp.]